MARSERSSFIRRLRPALPWLVLLVALWIGAGLYVHYASTAPTPPESPDESRPRVVSLVPQATDVILAIGCGKHLVAVSNFDTDPRVAHLPRVGDFQTADWETISGVHAQWIVTRFGPDRTPSGFVQRADALGLKRLNLLTETLDGPDKTTTIYHAIEQLGTICNEPAKAQAAALALKSRLGAIRRRYAAASSVPAMIVIGQEGNLVAGPGSYLTELLEIAGGTNVVSDRAARYPTLDREQVLSLRPRVILQLLPGASPQVIAQADAFWATMPDAPAVANHRVIKITDSYALVPGYHVGDLAERFAAALHPSDRPTTASTTSPTSTPATAP